MADSLKVKVIAEVDRSSSAISKFRDQLQQLADKASKGGSVPKIKISIDDSSIQYVKRELSALEKAAKSSGLGPMINIENLNQASITLDQLISKTNNLINQTIQLGNEQEKNKSTRSSTTPDSIAKSKEIFINNSTKQLADFEDYLKKLKPSATKEFAPDIERIRSILKENIETGSGSLPTSDIQAFKATQKSLGNQGGNLLTAIESKIKSLGSYAISAIFTYGAIEQLKEGFRTIVDIDNALTNINMTMPVTKSQMQEIGSKSVDMAKELGTSVQNVMGVAQIYANELESVDNMIQKSRPTVMLSTASGMGGSEAADTIQSALLQFDLAEDQAMHVSDVYQKVSANMKMEFKRGTQEIAEGIKASGAIAKESGYDLESYAATLGNIIETTRFGGAQVGNAQKMIMARVGGAKSDDVSAEEVSKTEEAYRKVGVAVRDVNGEFRKMPDILDDLDEKWTDLDSVQRSYIAEASAGNRNRSVFLSMMNSYDRQKELTEQAKNSDGFSEETNEKRLQSLQAKIEQFKASISGMWNDAVSSDVLKGLMDIANALAYILTLGDSIGVKIGLMVAAVPTLMALFNAFKTTKIAGGFKEAFGDIKVFASKIKEVFSLMRHEKLGIGDALEQSGFSVSGLQLGGVTALLTAGVIAYQAYSAHQQKVIDKGNEVIKNAEDQRQSFENNKNTLEGMESEFNRLSAGVDDYGTNISLSADDYKRYKDIVAQVLQISPELIAGYNDENEAIANKNGLLEKSIELTKEKNKQDLLAATSDKNINDAFNGKYKEYEKAIMGNWFGFGGLSDAKNNLVMKLGNSVQFGDYTKQASSMIQSVLGISKTQGEADYEFLQNHLDEIKISIDEIIAKGKELGYFDDEEIDKIRSAVQTYQVAKQEAETAAKGINPLLQNYASIITGYETLDPHQKEYLSDFIGDFRIELGSSEEDVSNMQGKIMSLIELLNKNTDSFKTLFSFDKSKMSAIQWENSVNEQIDAIAKNLELNPEQKKALQIKVGIEFMSDGSTTKIQKLVSDVSDTAKKQWGDAFNPDELRLDEWQYAFNHLSELSTMTWDEFKNHAENARKQSEAALLSTDELTKSVDTSIKAYDTVAEAREQYNEDGYLSADSLQSILGLGQDYINYLFDENGNLRSLESAYKDVITARLEDLKTRKISEINTWIDQMRNEKKTVDELTAAYREKAVVQMIGNLPVNNNTTYEDSSGNTVNLTDSAQYKAAMQYIDMIDNAINGLETHGLDVQSPNSKKRIEQEKKDAEQARKEAERKQKEKERKEKELAKAEKDYAKKQKDTNEKLEELVEKGNLEKLKQSIEQVSLVLERFDNSLELLDLKLEFAGDEDFEYRQDILAEKLDTSIQKGAALRGEFERLADTTPRTADEANELASSLERLGSDIRNNLSNIVKLNHELNMLQINAITASAENTTTRLQSMNSIIDYNRKMLSGESMFGASSAFSFDFLLPSIPRSALEQKRAENESLLSEQEKYENKIIEMKRVSLEKQFQENAAAREKERQQLIEDLNEAYETLQEKREEVRQLVEESTNETTAKVRSGSEESKAEVNEAASQITSAVSTAAETIRNIVIEAPSLGESWNTLLADVQAWVQQMVNSVSQLSYTGDTGNTGTVDVNSDKRDAVVNIASKNLNKKGAAFGRNTLWCGVYVNAMYKQAGVSIPDHTYVRAGVAEMKKKNLFRDASTYTPKKGDLIYFDWPNTEGEYNHVGIVESVDKDYVYTLEGNTTGGLSARRKRPRNSTISGYGAVAYASGGIVPESSTILAGEENRELAILPNGKVMILGQNGAGLYTVPEGTRIISNPETEQILKYTGSKINNTQIPKLAEGTGDVNISTDDPSVTVNVDVTVEQPASPSQFNFDDEKSVLQALKEITAIPDEFYQVFADDYAAYSKERESTMNLINSIKEAYSAGDKSLRNQALQLIDNRFWQDNVKLYSMQLDINRKAGEILRDRLRDAQASYEAAKAKGNLTPEVISAYLEGISSLTEKIQSIDNTFMSTFNSMTEFYVQQAEFGLKWHKEFWLAQEKEIAYQERQLELTTDYAQKLAEMIELTKSYRDMAESAKRAQDNAHMNANALFEDGTYYNITSQFSRDQIDTWFDANGDLSAQFDVDIRLLADSDQNLAKQFAARLQVEKKFWLEARQTQLDAEDKQRNMQKQVRQTQLDTYNTMYSKVLEMIEANYQAEQKMQETAHQNRMQQLDEQKTAMEKLYTRQMDLLDEVKSKEDYQRNLSDEQEKADKLQARIDVLSLDTSESARLERLNLEKQLTEQKKSIAQMQRDHEYEETKNALQKDLEAQQEHLENLTEEEDAYAQYQQEQLELRYSQEQRAAMATEALATGTLKVISSEGVKTYNDILNKGQGAAMTLQEAYEELAKKSGEKFENMGIDFNNLLNMFREAVDLSDRLANSGIIDTVTGENPFTGNTDITGGTDGLKRPDKNGQDLTEWETGNGGNTDLTGMTYEENQARLEKESSFRESEFKRAAKVLRNRLDAGLDTSAQVSYIQSVMDLIKEKGDRFASSIPGILRQLGITSNDLNGLNIKNWATGNEGNTDITGMSYEESEAKLQQDAAFRESEFKRAAKVLKNRIAAGMDTTAQMTYLQHVMNLIRGKNDPFASQMAEILSNLGLPSYHTGRAGINSKEDLAVILNTESVLKEDTVARLARMAQLVKSSVPLYTAAMKRFIPNTSYERVSSGIELGGVHINIEGNATAETVSALRSENTALLKQIGGVVRKNSGK